MINAAKWITAPIDMAEGSSTFKKTFDIEKEIKSATLYSSAMGVYVPYLNGKRVGKNVLAPGFTSYHNRVQYQEYDITDILQSHNEIEISVGQGWAVGHIGFENGNHRFADHTSVIASLEVTYEDGTKEEINTDTSWDAYNCEVTFSDIYHGETVDKTLDIVCLGKAALSEVNTTLVPQMGEFIVENERLAPIEIIHTPKGETVIDFGQNMTGYVEVSISGKRGSRIVIHHAEVLDKDGNFYTDNYRIAKNEITYILSGGEDVFKPSYSFQGFRYIRLSEFPFDTVNPENFRAIVVHSELKRTGYFHCGNDKINQLYHNIIWGQKSNYLDIPTDCPQRDERLGWTGDTQVFCRTAAINYDVEKFMKKWMADVTLEQGEDGSVRGVVPHASGKIQTRISAAWADAACIVPWEMYLAYGKKDNLEECFETMKKWVEYQHNTGPEEFLWLTGRHYGDWLAMDDGADSYVGATSNDLIASAFFAHSTNLLVQAGEALGKDMSEYRILYKNVVEAFREYFMENGMPKAEFPLTELLPEGITENTDTTRLGMTQTALTLILHFNLCTDTERPALAKTLADMIIKNDTLMTTGFIGTPYLLHALSDNGYTDLAYKLLIQEKNPSWLYSVCHGATTIWEHWNGIKEDGSFWSTDMNSFNHYSYGAVYDWIFGVAAGIKTVASAPAYKEITLCPHPNKCLGHINTSINSRNGKITSNWYYKDDVVYYEFEIPQGVRAYLTLPSGYTETLTEGTYHFAE